MAVYHQMGHHSENLLNEESLSKYQGAILSPVNYSESDIIGQVRTHQERGMEMIFDPQLYFPNSDRGQLPMWSYFPSDVDTADHSVFSWWKTLIKSLSKVNEILQPDAFCSPIVVPKRYSNEYYVLSKNIAEEMSSEFVDSGVEVIHTLLANLDDLGQSDRSAEIASIISGSSLSRVYLIVVSGVEPRREIKDIDELKGVMRLINYLEKAGLSVIVGFSSSDLILWKAAGATSCATGKFFNLRRFTPSRWDPPGGGGGQLPYWFEESMAAFLRESDLVRIHQADLISEASRRNPYSEAIFQKVFSGKAWLGESWRHYMFWFADMEARISRSEVEPREILKQAEKVWDILEEKDILMEERANDGSWLRSWRRALAEAFR